MHREAAWRPRRIIDLLAEVFSGEWGTEPSASLSNARVLRSTNIDDEGHVDYSSCEERYIAPHKLAVKRLKKDDILLEVSGGGPDKPVGRVAFFEEQSDQIYICSNFFRTLRVSKAVMPRFLHWKLLLLSTDPKIWSFQQQTTGIINLKTTEYLKQIIQLPSPSEQERIVQILDTLDTQIQETRRLIAKLKQVKEGLLHDLLTCGIDEHGDLRDPVMHPEQFRTSHFGMIPEGWEIRALDCFLTDIDAGKSPNCPDRPAGPDEWGILKVSAIHPEGFREGANKVIINSAYISPVYAVQDGDLLISRANTYELVGIVCLVRKPRPHLLLCDKTLRLHIDNRKALTEFIFYILQMPFVRKQIEIHATGSSGSMKNISQDSIKKLQIYVPSLQEQKQIIAILSASDACIATQKSRIDKLQQMKQGLMYDLLTGVVDSPSSVATDGE